MNIEFLALLVSIAVLAVLVIGIAVAIWFLRSNAKAQQDEAESLHDPVMLRELEIIREDRDKLEEKNEELKKQVDFGKLQVAEMKTIIKQKDEERENWEKHKKEFLDASKAAVSKSALDISSKLLEDHKKESKESREIGEKRVSTISTDLQEKFNELMKNTAKFEKQLVDQNSTISILNKTLREPAKIGRHAEISLESHLQSFDLQEGRDYLLQHSFSTDEGKLRPDAVVFLPDDYVFVIDSKTSVLLKDLEFAKTEEEYEKLLLESIKSSIKSHLRNLSNKDYKTAVQKEVVSAQRNFEPKKTVTFMWLPSDGILERIRRADPSFIYTASEKGITVVGPSGLNSALTVAKVKISMKERSENHERIVKETEVLIQYINNALKKVGNMDKAINGTNKAFEEFIGSVNDRLFPKMEKVIGLGIDAPPKGLVKLRKREKVLETIEAVSDDEALPPPESQDD